VNHNSLPADLAISKLETVFNQNIYYRSDQKLIKAFEEMKKYPGTISYEVAREGERI
jgi:hypothetical protein